MRRLAVVNCSTETGVEPDGGAEWPSGDVDRNDGGVEMAAGGVA